MNSLFCKNNFIHRIEQLCFYSALLFLLVQNLAAQTFYSDPDELAEAVNASTGGGTFIVNNGTYNDFEAAFEVVASAVNPILIKAESIGGVTLTGESNFVFKKSAYVTIEGFVFDGEGEETLVKLEGCNNIRICNNVFELTTTESIKWVFVGGFWSDNTFPFEYPSHHNRIDHNTFQNKTTPGHYITIDGSFDDTGSEEVYYQSQYDTIDHNYFKNNGPRAVNEQESIRIGWSEMSMSSGFTLVQSNLFEDCDGDPEIVSIKSCDNMIRNNTFRGCYGTLSLRHGNRNIVDGNYFFGNEKPVGTSPAGSDLYTGGIRIYGTDHLIINNYMEGLNGTRWDAPITLTLGDAVTGESSNLSKHFRAERVSIVFNTLVNNSHGIEIGYDNNDQYNKDLEDILIANNMITGSENSLVEIVDTDNDQGDNITWFSNLMHPTGSAQVLSGASTTVFDATAVSNVSPELVFDNTLGTWRSSENSPLLEYNFDELSVASDIDGQERMSPSNPGADHFSTANVLFRPLTPEDVGPQSQGEFSSSNSGMDLTEVLVFPIPTDDVLNIRTLNEEISLVDFVDVQGKVVFSGKNENPSNGMSLNTTELADGFYFVQFHTAEGIAGMVKIVVQH